MLQWGHRLSAMEIGYSTKAATSRMMLQWGHRLSAMEIHDHEDEYGDACHPSMGPPPFGDGDVDLGDYDSNANQVLQWGHRLSAMEMRRHWDTVRPDVWTLQWGHRLSAMEISVIRAVAIGQARPSMGPPPFGDGDLAAAREEGLAYCHLQWGHRLSAMEIGSYCLTLLSPVIPSMGPPPFGDGDPCCAEESAHPCPPSMGPPPFGDGDVSGERWRVFFVILQWGHRLSAMEIAICESLPSYLNVKVRICTRND